MLLYRGESRWERWHGRRRRAREVDSDVLVRTKKKAGEGVLGPVWVDLGRGRRGEEGNKKGIRPFTFFCFFAISFLFPEMKREKRESEKKNKIKLGLKFPHKMYFLT